MHLPTIFLTTILPLLTTSAPTNPTNNTNNSTFNPTNFLLLTTTSPNPQKNTTLLPSVNATSLFDPLAQSNYLLRLTGPGYGSLPRFNLTSSGTLETFASGPHGIGEFEYDSTRVRAGEELAFEQEGKREQRGNLALEDGFLLTVGGQREGWKICEGDVGQLVVAWKGNDTSCTDTYVQAAQAAPY